MISVQVANRSIDCQVIVDWFKTQNCNRDAVRDFIIKFAGQNHELAKLVNDAYDKSGNLPSKVLEAIADEIIDKLCDEGKMCFTNKR